MHGWDPKNPHRPFWFTVGGALEPGEDHAAAALRELHEEVGITATRDDLGAPIATCDNAFDWDEWHIVQSETYFALAVGDTTVSLAGLDAIERSTTDRADWWDPDDLDADGTAVTPELTDRMRAGIAAVRGRQGWATPYGRV